MAGCYILFSQTLGKFYTGATREDVSRRIKKHNNSANYPEMVAQLVIDTSIPR